MNFKEATDDLFDQIGHEKLAKELNISVASIRQARLNHDAAAHRAPPEQWREAVFRLALNRAEHYRILAEKLRADGLSGDKRRSRAKTRPRFSNPSMSMT